MSKKAICVIFLALLSGSAQAALLTDAELYFDPGSIAPDYYTRLELPDLTVQDGFFWEGDPDAVTDADILPVLKPGEYPEGYPFSQADYYQTPNVDYSADLTGGDLTVTFNTPGLYHVRVIYEGGFEYIYAVFAESGFKELNKKKDKSGPTKKLDPLPDADLFLVEKSDSTLDNSAKIWEKGGKEVERVNSRQDVVDKIKAKSQALGRKIHVEIDGHGTDGIITTGAGKDGQPPEGRIDLDSVEEFQKKVDDYVNHITFQGCSVGRGKDGKKFLKILADSIGKAAAWDQPVTVVDQNYFTVGVTAKWVEVKKASCILVPADADAMISAEDSCGHYWGWNSADLNFGGSEHMWTFLWEDAVYLRFKLPEQDLSLVSGVRLHLYGSTGGSEVFSLSDGWGGFYHYPQIAVYGLRDGVGPYTDDNGYERLGEDWLEGTGDWEVVPGITFNNAPGNASYEACADGSPTCSPDICEEGYWAPETAMRDIIEFDTATELAGAGPDWTSLDLGSAGAEFIQSDTNGMVTLMIASPYDIIQFSTKEYEDGAYAPTLELELTCSACEFGDINSDGIVNFSDMSAMANKWLEEVPEPCAESSGKKCRYQVSKLTPQNELKCPDWLLVGHRCIHGDCVDKDDCDPKLRFRFHDESAGYDCMIDFDLIDCAKTGITQLCTAYWTDI